MKQILAFFKLIRTLNLLFIAITQYLFQYFIVIPLFNDHGFIAGNVNSNILGAQV